MIKIKIEFLGGAHEVGKSGFLLDGRVALDYGVKIGTEEPEYLPSLNIEAVLLSHAHLDHCGSIPVLFNRGHPKTVATPETLDLSKMLLTDSYKVSLKQGYKPPYRKQNIKKAFARFDPIEYNEQRNVAGFNVEYFDAGHIPGSAGILLNKEGKRIFYTGDINLSSTYLLNGATLPEKADVLIMESTYGNREHPPRDEEEKRFVDAINEGLAKGEKILLPCFAVGRSQEILLMLNKHRYKKIAIDGMIKQSSEIILYYKNNIRNYKNLKSILERVTWVRGTRERDKAIDTKKIFVTTSGMMTGGPIVYLLEKMRNDNIRIIFTGYLVEDTPGRRLFETGIFSNEEDEFPIDAPMFRFDFSAHAGQGELLDIVRKLKPKKVFVVHGDDTDKFADLISDEFKDVDVEAPEIGDVATI